MGDLEVEQPAELSSDFYPHFKKQKKTKKQKDITSLQKNPCKNRLNLIWNFNLLILN